MSNTEIKKSPTETESAQVAREKLMAVMRRQRLQDFFFHKITLIFALSVLLMLGGIIVSLIIGSAPAFQAFGPVHPFGVLKMIIGHNIFSAAWLLRARCWINLIRR